MKQYQYQTLEEAEEALKDEISKDSLPSSLEELRYWLRRENITDISYLGFNIGKDSTNPDETGIFIEDGQFVIYQNGYDNQHNILYKGINESYAVKMFCSLLMKEIKIRDRIEKKTKTEKRKNTKVGKIIGIAVSLLFVSLCIFGVTRPEEYSYYRNPDTNSLYHLLEYYDDNYNSHYNWCVFDEVTKEWSLVDGADNENFYPAGIDYNDSYYFSDQDYDCTYDEMDIYNSRLYYQYNHYEPWGNDYYSIDGDLYYYFYDDYHWYYDLSKDQSGFYKYDKENNTWNYYCTYEQSETMNEDLHLYHERHKTDYDYYVKQELKEGEQVPMRFEETEIYSNYLDRQAEIKAKGY